MPTPSKEEDLLKQLLHQHLFPAVLEIRTIVGDDHFLEDLLELRVISLMALVQPAMTAVFLHYCGTTELDDNTALPLRKLELMARQFMLFPQLLNAKDIQVAFSSTGTKRRRRLPHFVEFIGRAALLAFEHHPLSLQKSAPNGGHGISAYDKISAVLLYMGRAAVVNKIAAEEFQRTIGHMHSRVWTPEVEEVVQEHEGADGLVDDSETELFREQVRCTQP